MKTRGDKATLEAVLVYDVLFHNEHVGAILGIVDVNDFDNPLHYELITEINKRADDGGLDALTASLIENGKYRGVVMRLMERAMYQPSLKIDAVRYAKELRIMTIEHGVRTIMATPVDHDSKAAMVEQFREQKAVGKRGLDIADMQQTFEQSRLDGYRKWHTGFPEFSKRYLYFEPGNLWLITAASSVGKTAMALEFMCRVKDAAITMISTEMTGHQLYSRLLARFSGVSAQRIVHSEHLKGWEHDAIIEAKQKVSRLNIRIHNSITDIEEIAALTAEQSNVNKLDILVVDYVQHLTAQGITNQYERHQRAANTLYQTALKNDVCIIALSQISTAVARDPHANFEAKGAGDWAECCDVGVRLKRKKVGNDIIFDIEKNRHGPRFPSLLSFNENYTKIEFKKVLDPDEVNELLEEK